MTARVWFVTNISNVCGLIERSVSTVSKENKYWMMQFHFSLIVGEKQLFLTVWILLKFTMSVGQPVSYLSIEWTICNTPLTQAAFGIDEGGQAFSPSKVCLCLCNLPKAHLSVETSLCTVLITVSTVLTLSSSRYK